jgi:two-component system, OmpR family, response regulator RpaA
VHPRKPVYSTAEAAKICRLSLSTMNRRFDEGLIQGFRVPGSRFRRVTHEQLLRFMRENGLPTTTLEPERKALLIGDHPRLLGRIGGLLKWQGEIEVHHATREAVSARLLRDIEPSVVFLGLDAADAEGIDLCRRMTHHPEVPPVPVVAVADQLDEATATELKAAGASVCIHEPINEESLTQLISNWLGSAVR